MTVQQLDRLRRFLELLYQRKISQDFDRVILVIGDEGVGKSTLMLQAMWLWEEVRGNDPTPESVLDNVVFGERDAFKQKLLHADAGEAISVQDAAHVLYRKDAMQGDQKEIEKTLLDIRIENYLILLGYQDWGDVADNLQRRRAKNVLRVTSRGKVLGYNRSSLDEKYEDLGDDEWPDHDFEDRFPSLEGTDLWGQFKNRDASKKRERLGGVQEEDVQDAKKREQIKTAIKARRPWLDEPHMTYEEVAELIDYSDTWARNRCNEWEKGAYRDLVSKDDVVNRVAEAD